jgi:DMSO/TMAO reductase YedYZ molybdopterin-dependent catalytic subunit
MKRLALAALLAAAACVAAPAAEPALSLISPDRTLALTQDDLRQMPRTELTATDPHENKEHRYSGVLVRDLLARAGAPVGEKLRGHALQLAVVFHSKDGYATLFALAEFDEAFSDRRLILADTEDGEPLSPSSGPLRLVVPGDKRAARWARMVTSIEVIQPSPSR